MPENPKNANELDTNPQKIEEKPVFSVKKSLSQMFHIILPLIFYGVAFTLQQSITLSFLLNKYKKEQTYILNAIGLTHIYLNCTVISISYGLLAGITSLGSNAYGAKEYQLMGLYIHRGRIVCISYLLITGIINFFFGHNILSIFISDPKVIQLIEIYIKCQVIVQILDGFYHVNVEYLGILEKGTVNLMICIPNCLLHFLWCYIYINILDLGVFGAGLSHITTQFLNFIISSLYIHIGNPCPESYFCINKECFMGLWTYLQFTASELVIIISEMWSLEIIGLIALYLGKINFASFILVVNIVFNIWAINYGFHSGTTIIIGTLITETTIDIVKKTINLLFIAANIILSIILILCAIFAPRIIILFISDPKNSELFQISLTCFYIELMNFIFELNLNLFSGIIRGFNRQKFVIIVQLIIFYPLLISNAIIFGKVLMMGSKGLFFACTITFLTGLICYFIYFIRLNFTHIKIEIEERLWFDQEVIKEDNEK